MAKDLKTILAGSKSSKVEKMDLSKWEKSKDGQRFAEKHTITKYDDRAGNKEGVYDSGKVKFEGSKSSKHHDQKDSVYESACNMTEAGTMCEVHGNEKCPSSKKLILSGGKKKLDEVLTKKTSAGETISDFVHSKNKMFKGDSKEQRINRALGAYYSKHPEKKK